MPKFSLLAFLIFICSSVFSQNSTDIIDEKNVTQILNYLASDSLRGRGNYSSHLDKAAHFISEKFIEADLEPFPAYSSYFQPFTYNDMIGYYDSKGILNNIVGVLPGKSIPEEAIIFCAHYDHIGVLKTGDRDSIYNGANDNASGVAAMLSLAQYFAKKRDNERTIIFCAFAGEEMGMIGSSVFADKIIAGQIKAVINLEMIGSCTGKNSFFITGSEYSDLEKIMKRNLKKEKIKIIQDLAPLQMLFKRSDNYPFALKGIPAHSIMCSNENDNCYHQTCDEVNRIDFTNMIKIIKSIAAGCETIIQGKDTPSKINVKNIR